MIDPHVHCRDGRQAYKETISHALAVASKQGIEKIFDMPNTDPPVLREVDVKRRLKLVPKGKERSYFLYIGLTPCRSQLKEAVYCYRKYSQVIGFKLYAGESVGNLAVTDLRDQEKIYRTLVELGYRGVIAVHCEKVAFFRPRLWNPAKPITHFYARPKQAETESIKDQIQLVKKTHFQGVLHIVHISCPESVEIVNKERKEIKITCAVTPHHILWNNEMLNRPDGLIYKMNPPLRDKKDVEKMRRYLKEEKIDWIETDHAPHSIGEKLFSPYLSGYPSLYFYKEFVDQFLPKIGVSKKLIKKLTFGNIHEIYRNKLK